MVAQRFRAEHDAGFFVHPVAAAAASTLRWSRWNREQEVIKDLSISFASIKAVPPVPEDGSLTALFVYGDEVEERGFTFFYNEMAEVYCHNMNMLPVILAKDSG